MKYFGIIDKIVATIFQLRWKIGNISDMHVSAIFCAMWVGGDVTKAWVIPFDDVDPFFDMV